MASVMVAFQRKLSGHPVSFVAFTRVLRLIFDEKAHLLGQAYGHEWPFSKGYWGLSKGNGGPGCPAHLTVISAKLGAGITSASSSLLSPCQLIPLPPVPQGFN